MYACHIAAPNARRRVWQIVATRVMVAVWSGVVAAFVLGTCASSMMAQTPGTIDASFDSNSGGNDHVFAVAVQPDGKVVIGGNFTTVGGVPRNRIARLNADGSLDPDFDPGDGANDFVYSLLLEPDGRIVVAGAFSTFAGLSRPNIVRLTEDGSLDLSFDAGTGSGPGIATVARQADGKYVLGGGGFGYFNGSQHDNIVRLNADGSVDDSFVTSVLYGSGIASVAVQPDGKILVAGNFNVVNGEERFDLVRLDADGALDPEFNPGLYTDNGIDAVAVQEDGLIVVGGGFTQINGIPYNNLARLDAYGGVDTDFNIGAGPNDTVKTVLLQPDGKILLGGLFGNVDGFNSRCFARLNADGTPDTDFSPGSAIDNTVLAMALQDDGRIVIGGYLGYIDGVLYGGVARFFGGNALPEVTLAATVPTVQAGSGEIGEFTLYLSAPQPTPIYVYYRLRGTAINGTDYVLQRGYRKIAAGRRSKRITVVPISDLEGVSFKNVIMTLKVGDGYTLGPDIKAKVKILAP